MNSIQYDYEKSVSLIYHNDSHRGPGKVVQNLKTGLSMIGITIHGEFDSRSWKYTGCLQYSDPDYLRHLSKHKTRSILLGPNLFVLPTDNPDLCISFDHFVTPSKWVKNLYEQFSVMQHKHIHVWPVGIDTKEWTDSTISSDGLGGDEIDCFIYFKNRTEQDLAVVEALCRKFTIKYKVIKYGSYSESELKNLCAISKFAILLTGTESQGIAYMQILSTNTPCYVFNSPVWQSGDKKISTAASSVPYFDDRCGVVTNDVNLEHFKDFIDGVNFFQPRKYILENHTLEKSAQDYYNLLRISNGEAPIK